MIEGCEHLRFALEPSQTVGVAGEGVGQHLDRDLPIKVCIGGLIDLSHPTLANEGGDVIVAESGADSQGHELC